MRARRLQTHTRSEGCRAPCSKQEGEVRPRSGLQCTHRRTLASHGEAGHVTRSLWLEPAAYAVGRLGGGIGCCAAERRGPCIVQSPPMLACMRGTAALDSAGGSMRTGRSPAAGAFVSPPSTPTLTSLSSAMLPSYVPKLIFDLLITDRPQRLWIGHVRLFARADCLVQPRSCPAVVTVTHAHMAGALTLPALSVACQQLPIAGTDRRG